MRFQVGSMNVATAGTAKQLLAGDSMSRVIAFTFQAPASNGAQVYWGTASTISSAGSYVLSSNTTYPGNGQPFTVPAGRGVPPSSFWMNASASTTATIRYVFATEP